MNQGLPSSILSIIPLVPRVHPSLGAGPSDRAACRSSRRLYEDERLRRGEDPHSLKSPPPHLLILARLDLYHSYYYALEAGKGHSLSVSESRIPDFGKQQTIAGNLNLMNTEKHNLNANAFVSRNIPKFPEVPNFNTVGGGVDYMFNKKVGASLDVAHTPFLQRTDVNAMGKLNLYQNPTTSLDFGAGASKSFSPHIPNSSWEPNFRFSLSKYF
ncbi:unnamed protein product [Danaus chrysippus]|uniref:(African queen) hypothetical protein n=1 Tax=Danaus chrysippus TaxID=151541 RepID=A0A8J2VW75_9NEOP|nr:unnamed protein product [Danaus chrysippus]